MKRLEQHQGSRVSSPGTTGWPAMITLGAALVLGAVTAAASSESGAQLAADECPPAWVLVEFTVTTAGETRDVEVVEASQSGMYESLAERVVSRWQWEPREAEERVSQRIEFEVYGCSGDSKPKEEKVYGCNSVCA